MKVFKIEVSQELVNYIQRLSYDVSMRQNIIKQMISESLDESILESKAFIKYSNELSEMNAEFEMAKAKLMENYLPVGFEREHKANWNLDYSTNVLTINAYCDCGIKALEALGYEGKDVEDTGCSTCSCN